jgi:hypothetical protein
VPGEPKRGIDGLSNVESEQDQFTHDPKIKTRIIVEGLM